MSTENENTEQAEPNTDKPTSGKEVPLPIIPVESDATPAPPAAHIEAQELPVSKAASFDLSLPILEVLTDPTM